MTVRRFCLQKTDDSWHLQLWLHTSPPWPCILIWVQSDQSHRWSDNYIDTRPHSQSSLRSYFVTPDLLVIWNVNYRTSDPLAGRALVCVGSLYWSVVTHTSPVTIMCVFCQIWVLFLLSLRLVYHIERKWKQFWSLALATAPAGQWKSGNAMVWPDPKYILNNHDFNYNNL